MLPPVTFIFYKCGTEVTPIMLVTKAKKKPKLNLILNLGALSTPPPFLILGASFLILGV